MTTQDYIKLARALAHSRPRVTERWPEYHPMISQWRSCREELLVILTDDNPEFNLDKFIIATEGGRWNEK